jgi:hypothetical protein
MSLQEDLGTQYLQKYMDSTILANYVESGLTMMCHLMEKISSLSNTDIYYMNGRTLYERITYECCRSLNVQSYALEINSLEDRIQEFEGTAINTESYRSQAEKLWEQFLIAYGEQVTRSMAEKYFENRRLNHKQNQFLRFLRDADTSITKSSKIKIAFFSSSNEELASIYSIYRQSKPNQDHIIKELILRFTSKSFVDQCMFIIRVHPNVRRKKSEDKLFYDNLVNSENIIIHNYQSNVDSYNLISNADIVVTVGSTIGLEASFLGKMSFSFAKTLWGDLGAVKLVSSIQDIFNYATNYDLEKAKLGALKYGLFMQYYGKEFEYCSLKQKRLLATKNSFDVLENVSKLLTWQKR